MFGDAVFLSVFVGFFVCGWGVNTNLMEYGIHAQSKMNKNMCFTRDTSRVQ